MSNQIEQIQRLYAKPKMYPIPKESKDGMAQLQFEIHPLSIEDLGVLNMAQDMPLSEVSKNVKVMFAKSLKITEEQAASISVEYMQDLMEAVMDANNLKEDDLKRTGIQEFIKDKQAQMTAQGK